jgi:hypothetical protein
MQKEEYYFVDMCLKLEIGERQLEKVLNNDNVEQKARFLPEHRRKYLLELDKRAMEVWGQG